MAIFYDVHCSTYFCITLQEKKFYKGSDFRSEKRNEKKSFLQKILLRKLTGCFNGIFKCHLQKIVISCVVLNSDSRGVFLPLIVVELEMCMIKCITEKSGSF